MTQTEVERGISHKCSPDGMRDDGPDFIDFEALEDYQPPVQDPKWNLEQAVRLAKACDLDPTELTIGEDGWPDYDELEEMLNAAGYDTYQSDTCFEVGTRHERYNCGFDDDTEADCEEDCQGGDEDADE